MAASRVATFWNHPAGPKTSRLEGSSQRKRMGCLTEFEFVKHELGHLIVLVFGVHFWAPTFKWGISIANIADFAKPPEKISYPQQMAVTATGMIWSRYSMVITPKNWNLFAVNISMGATGIYQLSRKLRQDYGGENTVVEKIEA